MRKILLFIFILTGLTLNGQITRRVDIWRKPMTKEVLTASFTDSIVSIHFMGLDSRYSQLIEYITLFSGPPADFYVYLEQLQQFINESAGFTEKDISKDINGQHVSISKFAGMRTLYIYEKDGNGYTGIQLSAIPKFKDKFIQWAEKNNVAYK